MGQARVIITFLHQTPSVNPKKSNRLIGVEYSILS